MGSGLSVRDKRYKYRKVDLYSEAEFLLLFLQKFVQVRPEFANSDIILSGTSIATSFSICFANKILESKNIKNKLVGVFLLSAVLSLKTSSMLMAKRLLKNHKITQKRYDLAEPLLQGWEQHYKQKYQPNMILLTLAKFLIAKPFGGKATSLLDFNASDIHFPRDMTSDLFKSLVYSQTMKKFYPMKKKNFKIIDFQLSNRWMNHFGIIELHKDLKKLLDNPKHKVNVWVLGAMGDDDFPVEGNLKTVQDCGCKICGRFGSAKKQKKEFGWIKTYENLTVAGVHRSSHMMVYFNKGVILGLLNNFLEINKKMKIPKSQINHNAKSVRVKAKSLAGSEKIKTNIGQDPLKVID